MGIAAARFPRITVRGLMTAVAATGLLLSAYMARRVWWHLLVVATLSVHAWGPFLFLIWAFGPRLRRRIPRDVVLALGIVSSVSSLYLLWTFYLICSESWSDAPRGFPYPDRVLYALNEWFDARHPVSRDLIKLHWEWPRVTYVAGIATILSAIAAGFFVALLVPPRPPKNET